MALRIHHFAITVKDLEKSIDFYMNKLGFQIHGEDTRNKNYIYLTLNKSDILLELFKSPTKNQDFNYGNMRSHLALTSEEIEKDLEIIENRGVKSLKGLQIIPGDVKIFTILDPDGYYIDVGQKIG